MDVRFLEHLTCPAVLCGPDGRILVSNASFRELFEQGRPHRGASLGELVSPQARERLSDALFFGPGSRAPLRRVRVPLTLGGPESRVVDLFFALLVPPADGQTVFLGLLSPALDKAVGEGWAWSFGGSPHAAQGPPLENRSAELTPDDRGVLLTLRSGFRDSLASLSAQLTDLVAREHVEGDETILRTALNNVHALNDMVTEIVDHDLLREDFQQRELDFDLRVTLQETCRRSVQLVVDPHVPSFLRGHPGLVRRVLIELLAHVPATRSDPSPVLSVRRIFEDETHVSLIVTLTSAHEPDPGASHPENVDALPNRRLIAFLGGTTGRESDEEGSVASWVRLRFEKGESPPRTLPQATRSLSGRKIVFAVRPGLLRSELLSRAVQEGAESILAHSLDEVRALFRTSPDGQPPADVVVVDLALPNLEAVELARAVREDPTLRAEKVPLLLLTEVGQPGDAAWAKGRGFSAYLSRPFEIQTALALLADLAGRVETSLAPAPLLTRHSFKEAHQPRLRVLVVDDDPVMLMAIGAAVERIGHVADLASGGAEGVGYCAQYRHDLVLSDLRMPEPDGIRLVQFLRHGERLRGLPRVPVVIMSIDPAATNREPCIEAGADAFLQKPIGIERLQHLVDCVLRGDPLQSDGMELVALRQHRESVVADSEAIDDAPSLDLEHLDMVSLGDPALRRDMLNTFVAEVPLGIERLGAAIRTRNVREAVERADSLCSLCSSLGAWESARGFTSLERAIKDGVDESALASLESLTSIVDRLVDFLKRTWLDHPRPAGSMLLADHSVVPPGLVISAQKAA